MKKQNLFLLLTVLNFLPVPSQAMMEEGDNIGENIIGKKSNPFSVSNVTANYQSNEEKEARFDSSQLLSIAKKLRSVEVKEDNLQHLKNIQAIVLIGSSGAGKTTLLNEIREKCTQVSIPRRFITRAARLNEDDEENIHITKELFEEKVEKGEISCAWTREFENGRKEYYGFENVSSNLPIFSANNSFLYSEAVYKNPNYLIISVYAPEDIRKNRLLLRSPDLSLEELKIRVDDPYKEAVNLAHIVVHNYGEFEKRSSKFELVTFINALKAIQSGWGKIKDLNNHEVEYHTRLFDIITHDVEFSDGQRKTFQYARRSPGVRILAKQNDKLLITAEWRTEINGWDFRLPGGKFFENTGEYAEYLKKFGKDALPEQGKESAITELKEECGLTLTKEEVRHIATSKCGATVDWDLFYYVANLSSKSEDYSHTSPEGERTLSLWLTAEEVLDLCVSGAISEDRTAATLMRFILNTKEIGEI